MRCCVDLAFMVSIVFLTGCATLFDDSSITNLNTPVRSMKKAFSDLTPRQEYFLGRSIAATVLTESQAIDSQPLRRYLNELGQ